MPRNLACVVLGTLVAGCAAQGPSGAHAGGAGTPVILITIDTLRADRLPAYGYTRVSTPAIDALRRDAVLFENAYTHCPLTLPAHVSLLTGLLPPEHGVRNNLGYRLEPRRHPTLASLLKAQGYATGASVSAYVLRGATGLEEGFDFYSEGASAAGATAAGEVQRSGLATVQEAVKWLQGVRDQPFFLFVHLYEPHAPYEPPEPLRSRYGATYDGEIAAADAALGQLLEAMRKDGRYDPALVILASDHGEGLGDHGEQEHGILLYRETLRVPLLVKLPRARRAGATQRRPVGLRDVLPTVAAVVGFALPEGARGGDLLATGAGQTQYGETYYPQIHLGWSELRSLVDERYHYIAAPRAELYALASDPAERHDLASDRADVARAMRAALERIDARFAAPEVARSEERERLASLGYLAGGPSVPEGPLPNPRDEIASYAQIRSAFQLAAEGQPARALAAFDALLAANPRLFDVAVERGALLARLGRQADAERAYLSALAIAPQLASSVTLSLGRLRLEMGKLDQAEADARGALVAEPDAAHELLASVALAHGDLEAAEREARFVTSDVGARSRSAVILAEVQARRGRLDAALAVLTEAYARDAPLGLGPVPGREFVRGDVLARMGRHREAEQALRAEIVAFPRNARAYASLAIVTALRGGSRQECREILETMARVRPGGDTALLAAKALDFVGDAEGARAWRRRARERSTG